MSAATVGVSAGGNSPAATGLERLFDLHVARHAPWLEIGLGRNVMPMVAHEGDANRLCRVFLGETDKKIEGRRMKLRPFAGLFLQTGNIETMGATNISANRPKPT